MESEKKSLPTRPRESLPFGMKIREAAHKAAFGGAKRGVLQRYATFFQRKEDKPASSNIDDLLDEDESDSVSLSDSCSESVSLSSIDLDAEDIAGAASTVDLKAQQKLLKKKSVRKKLSILHPKADPEDNRWFSGPIKNPLP